jgi:hypothetical protein
MLQNAKLEIVLNSTWNGANSSWNEAKSSRNGLNSSRMR